MQALRTSFVTIPVIDKSRAREHRSDMFEHDEIRAELIRQIEAETITQADVARALKVAPPRINEIKVGKRRIQPHEMPVLVRILRMADEMPKETAQVVDFMAHLPADDRRMIVELASRLAASRR